MYLINLQDWSKKLAHTALNYDRPIVSSLVLGSFLFIDRNNINESCPCGHHTYMYFRFQCIPWYNCENDEVERILFCTCTVLCYKLECIYIAQIATIRCTSPVFAFNIQSTTKHSTWSGDVFGRYLHVESKLWVQTYAQTNCFFVGKNALRVFYIIQLP